MAAPIMNAIHQNNIKKVKKIINKSKENIYKCDEEDGSTVLMVAAQYGHTNIFKLLIDNIDDCKMTDFVNIRRHNGVCALSAASISGNLDIINILIKKGANVNNRCNIENISPLIMASQFGHIDSVKILIKNGAIINTYTFQEIGPLYLASYYGHIEVVKELIENGADINKYESKDGFTPLYAATIRGHIQIVKLLIEVTPVGANINICDHYGRSPLFVASEFEHIDIATVLINDGANVNKCCSSGCSPLHMAVQENYKNMVVLLINAGAIINERSLIMASQKGHIDIVDILIKANADINKCDDIGAFPLMAASYYGHTEVVKLLIKNGADINKLTNAENSLLFLALKNEHYDIANILIESGANIDKKCCKLIVENNNKSCICGKEKQFICSQCKIFGYCSLACQQVDWKTHKKICKLLS